MGTIDQEDLARLLAAAADLAMRAGEAILALSRDALGRTDKADGSPLTSADLASHRLISSGLERLRPAMPIVSEEGDLPLAGGAPCQTYWLIDPLDGTKEFIQGLPEYTVNVALVDRARPVLGVVYVPPTGELYGAAAGRGACKSVAGGPPTPIRADRCAMPRTAVVSRSHLTPQTERFLARLGVERTVHRGSALKLCAVAEGAADLYPRIGPINYWDTAAGTAVAREAGCRVLDLFGRDLMYDLASGLRHVGLIAGPADLPWAEILAALAEETHGTDGSPGAARQARLRDDRP